MVVLLNGIFKRARRVWKLPHNPVADVGRLTVPKTVERFADALGYSVEYHLVPVRKSKRRAGVVVEA